MEIYPRLKSWARIKSSLGEREEAINKITLHKELVDFIDLKSMTSRNLWQRFPHRIPLSGKRRSLPKIPHADMND
jgi:hypothetical protein